MEIGYNKAINVPNLDTVYLRGNCEQEWRAFRGLGKDGLLTINTKTYLEEPIRSQDGSMENIEDAVTFIVPQVEFNFKYFNLTDYVDMCNILEDYNQFEAKYFDVRYKQWVTHKMYCKPQEMTKIYNLRTSVIGVFDYKVQFVGTLNDIPETVTLTLYPNGGTFINARYNYKSETMPYKSNVIISNNEINEKSGYTLSGWNTEADGSGMNYNNGDKLKLVSNLTLYAQWQEI